MPALATLHATVSASFIIEQEGLPSLTGASSGVELWNEDEPINRLKILQQRHEK